MGEATKTDSVAGAASDWLLRLYYKRIADIGALMLSLSTKMGIASPLDGVSFSFLIFSTNLHLACSLQYYQGHGARTCVVRVAMTRCILSDIG
jgi:hypothetical protein